jgi:hypothetical protein
MGPKGRKTRDFRMSVSPNNGELTANCWLSDLTKTLENKGFHPVQDDVGKRQGECPWERERLK